MFLFLLDLNHYLGNLTFIFRFREIYLLLQVRYTVIALVGLISNEIVSGFWAVFLASSGRLPILNVFTISPKERISIQRRFDENTNLRGSYYKAPMVTPIETERGIDPSRFNGWHEIWTNSPSGLVLLAKMASMIACAILLAKMASRTGPTHQNGELVLLLGPTRHPGELGLVQLAKMTLTLGLIRLFVESDKIGAAPYDGCLRTHVEGIKPFVVRFGVKVLMTCFPARPLRSSLYVEVIRHVAADDILYGAYTCGISEDARILAKRQILGSRIRVFDTMPRDVRGAMCWV
ncbi:hypothetical protein DY000_02022543 [Brassica cretica]|uniref:Uncharacterized protein n=1 Tax=Brassica cretica TaxID=69181 RepID=A0ABQ7ENP0_BRACR|nr:hypothetical protein DY000_02022543 [Brassica cretica]